MVHSKDNLTPSLLTLIGRASQLAQVVEHQPGFIQLTLIGLTWATCPSMDQPLWPRKWNALSSLAPTPDHLGNNSKGRGSNSKRTRCPVCRKWMNNKHRPVQQASQTLTHTLIKMQILIQRPRVGPEIQFVTSSQVLPMTRTTRSNKALLSLGLCR